MAYLIHYLLRIIAHFLQVKLARFCPNIFLPQLSGNYIGASLILSSILIELTTLNLIMYLYFKNDSVRYLEKMCFILEEECAMYSENI